MPAVIDYLQRPQRLLPQSSQALLQADEVDVSDPDDGSDEDNTPESASVSNTVSGGVYALVKPLNDGDVELRAFRTGRNHNFCFRAPVVVSKSTRAPANAACPARWTQFSCSCVAELSSDWVLRVKKRSSSVGAVINTTSPVDVSADAALAVSSLGIFMLPNNVVSLCVCAYVLWSFCWFVLLPRLLTPCLCICLIDWLNRRLVGESASEKPVDVTLRLMYATNKVVANSAQLVLVDSTSALTTVYVYSSQQSCVCDSVTSLTVDFVLPDVLGRCRTSTSRRWPSRPTSSQRIS